MHFNCSLLEITSLTQNNAPTGGILGTVVGGHFAASQITVYAGWPVFPTLEFCLTCTLLHQCPESAQVYWPHTAARHGPWLTSPLQLSLIKAAQL